MKGTVGKGLALAGAFTAVMMLAMPAFADVYDEVLPLLRSVKRDSAASAVDVKSFASAEVSRGKIEGAPADVADQAYRIEIAPGGVTVTAGGDAGERYAKVTLGQLAALADGGKVPAARIVDWPALKWRGLMNDCGRNYLALEGVKVFIDLAAKYKMNLFHWHLSDYHGWRLESKKYPKLTAPETMTRQIGKFYTQDEFKEIVAYAKARGVTVMPELDVPGHTLALRKGLGVSRMNTPGVDKAVSELFDELCSLASPEDMPFIHLGTDEVRVEPEKVPGDWCSKWAATVAERGRACVLWAPGQPVESEGEIIDMAWYDNHVTNSTRRAFDAARMYYMNSGPERILNHVAFCKPCRWDIDPARKLGAIACCWHDDNVGEDTLRLFANAAVVPAVLGFADNYWAGREKDLLGPEGASHAPGSYRGRLPPRGTEAFALAQALERRIVAQRDKVLTDLAVAFPYVAQTEQRWRIRWADGRTIAEDYSGGMIDMAAFTTNKTGEVIAETWVYSPEKRKVGAWIGFTATGAAYTRQHDEPLPKLGEWNKYGSTVEVNGVAVAPPKWKNPGGKADWSKLDADGKSYKGAVWSDDLCETPLDEDWYFIRKPTEVELEKGWNHVRLSMVKTDKVKGRFWRGVFRLLEGTSEHPREVEGIRWSATAPEAVVVSNSLSRLAFDARGRVCSLRTLADPFELVSRPAPFCKVRAKRRTLSPSVLTRRGDGALEFGFGNRGSAGSVTLAVDSFGPGWTFKVVSCTVKDAERLVLGNVDVVCRKYRGGLANMFSDDRYGVCIRAYGTEGRMALDKTSVRVDLDRVHGFEGFGFGLVAAARDALVPALREMTVAAGAPRTVNGGAWSLGAEANRGSYCFAIVTAATAEDWVDMVLRGGYSTIHLADWWRCLGHYEPNTNCFPRGEKDLKAVCDAFHAAGLKVSFHCLTGAVSPRDAWITPKCRAELKDWNLVTLARDLSPTDTVMYVEEPVDIEKYHTFHSYSSRGNTFRSGTELIRYTGVKNTPPYAFTGVERGAWGTDKTGVIPAGTKIHYLFQRYNAFYPQPDSRLADDVADAIAEKSRLMGADQIYLDGAEAVRDDRFYTEDRYREKIMKRLGGHMLVEGSNGDAFTWWYLSRYGAWDRAYWGMKRMHDEHLKDIYFARMCNLLEAQMGWWNPVAGDSSSPGHRIDDMEYFVSRNAAHDAAASMQGVHAQAPGPYQFTRMQQLTLFGWYERFRLARAFTAEAMAKLKTPRQEVRLRQDAGGYWRLYSVDRHFQRVSDTETTRKWQWDIKTKPEKTALRVEALYYVDTASTNRVKLLRRSDFAVMSSPHKVEGVESRYSEKTDGKIGPVFVIDAKNNRAAARGAETCVVRRWTKQPYFNAKGCYAFGLWVKGDGSGADLWLVIETPRLYHWGRSYHRVKLDFKGWRRFTFPMRERDIDEAYSFAWQERMEPMVCCATKINMGHIGSFRVYLNELPPGKDVHVEISEVTAMPAMKKKMLRSEVRFGDTAVPVPFEMTSGDYAELEDGVWTHYAEYGDVLAKATGTMPAFETGASEVSYVGKTADGGEARAEVTLFAQHSPVAAVKPAAALSSAQKRSLAYEAVMPCVYRPAQGLKTLEKVRVRPGGKARLELTIHGPVSRPAVEFGGRKLVFDVDLEKCERLYCKDGINWRAVDGKRVPIASGRLAEPLPVLTGAETEIIFSSADDAKASARIEMAKRYVD